MSPAQDVTMQVRHRFASVGAVVDDQSIAAFFQPQPRRDVAGFEQQMAKHTMVFRGRFGDTGNRFLRHKQHMHRGLRFDVAECQQQIVLVNNVGRDFARDDFFKEGLAHSYCTISEQPVAPESLLKQWRK